MMGSGQTPVGAVFRRWSLTPICRLLDVGGTLSATETRRLFARFGAAARACGRPPGGFLCGDVVFGESGFPCFVFSARHVFAFLLEGVGDDGGCVCVARCIGVFSSCIKVCSYPSQNEIRGLFWNGYLFGVIGKNRKKLQKIFGIG